MSTPIFILTAIMLSIMLVPVGVYLVYRLFLAPAAGSALSKAITGSQRSTCKCGYPLMGLDMARCPECGRVIGFDVTAEQLGLSCEDLARAGAKRREREPPDTIQGS